jgi:hypothetical protein
LTTGTCRRCGSEIDRDYRFCPWCGRAQRLKLTEFFAGHAEIEADAHRALRVSRYLGEGENERHVRFSVWSEPMAGKPRVEAAVSLDEEEADRVALFLETSREELEAETF